MVNRLGARSLSPRMRHQLMESATVVTTDPFAGQFVSYLRRVYSVPVSHHAVELDRAVSALLYPAGCDAWYVPDAAVRACPLRDRRDPVRRGPRLCRRCASGKARHCPR